VRAVVGGARGAVVAAPVERDRDLGIERGAQLDADDGVALWVFSRTG